jgi:hypothetical protein
LRLVHVLCLLFHPFHGEHVGCHLLEIRAMKPYFRDLCAQSQDNTRPPRVAMIAKIS